MSGGTVTKASRTNTVQGENAAKQVYDKAMELGFGKEDFCATIKAVKAMQR